MLEEPNFDRHDKKDIRRDIHNVGDELRRIEKRLQKRFEKQTSLIHAMFELMKQELKLSEQDLIQKLAEIVRERGERLQEIKECRKCDRPLHGKTKCMFCGKEVRPQSIFEIM